MTPVDPGSLTVVVLTFNEERNLAACLESVSGMNARIVVVDSGSTDRTVPIATQRGATVIAHGFETHARQWKWALDHLPVPTDWILALDADQRLTPELRDEIVSRLSKVGQETAGFYVNRRQIFRGRWIRHGGYYPKYLLKLFRRAAVSVDEDDLVDHHFTVDGRTTKCRADLIEDNQNEADIAVWSAKHNAYAVRQARQELRERRGPTEPLRSALGPPDARVRWLKQQWRRLPLYVRPCGYFVYRYIARLGFLDGREGFVFHVLQGFWYRLLVDINLDEQRRAPAARDVVSGEPHGVARKS